MNIRAGLCTDCAHRRVVRSRRGSSFLLCGLSRTDPRFPRYPRLPVLACDGFRAAENISAEQLSELKVIQDNLERAYRDADPDRAVRLNHEYHRLINVAADSPKLTQFMSGITRYQPESVFPTLQGWPAQSIRDHRRLIDALERRDPDDARRAIAEHFTVGVAPLTEHLIARGVIAKEAEGG